MLVFSWTLTRLFRSTPNWLNTHLIRIMRHQNRNYRNSGPGCLSVLVSLAGAVLAIVAMCFFPLLVLIPAFIVGVCKGIGGGGDGGGGTGGGTGGA